MIALNRTFFFLTLICVLLTLVKEISAIRFYLLDIPLGLSLLAVASGKLLMPRRFTFSWCGIDTTVLLLVFIISVSFVLSDNHRQSLAEYLDWIRVLLVYFGARMLATNVVAGSSWLKLFWFAAVLLLVIGVVQLITNSTFGLVGNYFGANLAQEHAASIRGYGTANRVSGTTSNPIVYAIWLTMFGIFALSSLARENRPMWFFVLSLFMLVTIVASLSRGAILAFGLSWILLVFQYRHTFISGKSILVIAFVVSFGVPLAAVLLQHETAERTLEVLEGRIKEDSHLEADSERVAVINMGLELLERPKVFLVGTGPDNVVYSYFFQNSTTIRIDASDRLYQRSGIHNLWIKTLVEFGVFTLAVFAFFWLQVVALALRLARDQGSELRMWGRGLLAFIAPYLVLDAMVYESTMTYHLLIPIFALVALAVSLREEAWQSHGVARSASAGAFSVAGARPVTGS